MCGESRTHGVERGKTRRSLQRVTYRNKIEGPKNFGPAFDGKTIKNVVINGNVTVDANNFTFKNVSIKGTLTINNSKTKNVVLENVTVTGTTILN